MEGCWCVVGGEEGRKQEDCLLIIVATITFATGSGESEREFVSGWVRRVLLGDRKRNIIFVGC